MFAEDEDDGGGDETLRKDGRSGESNIPEFPTPDRRGHPLSVPESPEQPTLTQAASGREAGGWDAPGGRVQELTGLQPTATGPGYQAVIHTTRWLPRTVVGPKLVRSF